MNYINEATKKDLLNKSLRSQKGRERYNRRKRSKIGNKVKQYNNIDMNKLFKQGILDINIDVQGETDNYVVRISFGGILDEIHRLMKGKTAIDLSIIIKALRNCMNREDTYVHCSCPDATYSFNYWSTLHNYNSGEPQYSNGKKIRNPNDTLGSACKHVLLVLSNVTWLIKVASTINNYIKYVQSHYKKQYANIIYPAIYDKKYQDPVQTSIFDKDELDKNEIDAANDEGRVRGQFKPGNKQGVRFAPSTKTNSKQQQFDLDSDKE